MHARMPTTVSFLSHPGTILTKVPTLVLFLCLLPHHVCFYWCVFVFKKNIFFIALPPSEFLMSSVTLAYNS